MDVHIPEAGDKITTFAWNSDRLRGDIDCIRGTGAGDSTIGDHHGLVAAGLALHYVHHIDVDDSEGRRRLREGARSKVEREP
jgi:hypothetical protein